MSLRSWLAALVFGPPHIDDTGRDVAEAEAAIGEDFGTPDDGAFHMEAMEESRQPGVLDHVRGGHGLTPVPKAAEHPPD